MAAANWFRYSCLAYVSRPKGARQLYRLVKRHRVCRIVEVGISDVGRSVALVEVAQRYAGQKKVCYTGIDWFDTRPAELAALTLKQAYQILRATGASVRLVPGAPGTSLAAAANAHQNTDLMVISPHVTDGDLQAAWFYVPRMLHQGSLILHEHHVAEAESSYSRITPAQVAVWAGGGASRRAA